MRSEQNEEMVERYKKYREENFNPTNKLIAKHLGVSNGFFSAWYRGQHNFGQNNLDKINNFLESRGY